MSQSSHECLDTRVTDLYDAVEYMMASDRLYAPRGRITIGAYQRGRSLLNAMPCHYVALLA